MSNDFHEAAFAKAKKALGSQCACCILISCSEPADDGNMNVEMCFDGDEALAGFLIQNAQQVFEERSALQESR